MSNFRDSGAKKEKPDFSNYGGFREEDWDRYTKVIVDNEPGTRSVRFQAGARFTYANQGDTAKYIVDALHMLAPNPELVSERNRAQDFNDASYVVLYHNAIDKVLLAGGADDATWEYVKRHYETEVSNVALLIAPHHGRKSERSYKFLDYVNPKLSLVGCAPSEHLVYDPWNYRTLRHITNNQCGCIVAEGSPTMNIYVENDTFSLNSGGDMGRTNEQGFHYLGTVEDNRHANDERRCQPKRGKSIFHHLIG